jgi:hypothetical protein
MSSYSFFLHINVKELKVKIHLSQFNWKCTPIALDVINFAKDYEKDSYNKRIFIEKKIYDKNILATLKKHS